MAAIAWRKARAGEGRPEKEFERIEAPDFGPFGIEGETECHIAERTIPSTIEPGGKSGKNAEIIRVRQIRRPMPDGQRAAFVTSDFSMSPARVAGGTFSRRSRENFSNA